MDLLHIAAVALTAHRENYPHVNFSRRCEITYEVFPGGSTDGPALGADVSFTRTVYELLGRPIPEEPWQARERQQEGATQ